jgi:transposase-like protein
MIAILGIEDRVHIMVDINDDTQIVRRHAEVTGVVRRRRWNDEEKGRIVAEAIAPGAVIAEVARQHDLGRCHSLSVHRTRSAASIELDQSGQGRPIRAVFVVDGPKIKSWSPTRQKIVNLIDAPATDPD